MLDWFECSLEYIDGYAFGVLVEWRTVGPCSRPRPGLLQQSHDLASKRPRAPQPLIKRVRLILQTGIALLLN
jgi:hypothetical protein